MGEIPEWENRVYGKRKERLAREGPGGNELVVVQGSWRKTSVQQSLKIIFWVCFCVQRGFVVSHRGGYNEYNITRKYVCRTVVFL